MRRSFFATALAVIALATFAHGRAEPAEVEFRLDTTTWDTKPTKVNVAGDFNGWSKDAAALENDGNGVYSTRLKLDEGLHGYKFVIDGERWITDPRADTDLDIDDTFGGKNSAVIVGPDARKLPPPQDNAINTAGIVHRPEDAADLTVVDEHTIRVRIRVQKDDVKSAFVIAESKSKTETFAMRSIGTTLGYESFVGLATVPSGESMKYWISLTDGKAIVDVGTAIRERKNPNDTSKDMAVSVNLKPTFITPKWARDAVWYQIFPERFRNGDPTNDPGDFWYERLEKWTSNWYSVLPGETPGDENFFHGVGNVWKRRYGGDIAGIQQSLPYLKSVGINAIYLNPIFEAESMHKYDTADYRHVDDNFGVRDEPKTQEIGAPERAPTPYQRIGNHKFFELDGTPAADNYEETDDPATWKWTKSDLLFISFLREAKAQGFHVIIDGVFNHVGQAHPFFQDVIAKGKDSKYADWFWITGWPDKLPADPTLFGEPGGLNYKAWDKDSGALPAFKKTEATGLAQGPHDHIIAVTKRWLAPGGDASIGIDGIRLDVPNDIPHAFWIEWRKVVKETKPDAYITGEIWSPAQPWINAGDQFDAVMDYQFAMAACDFFANKTKAVTPTQFDAKLNTLVYGYPLQSMLVMQNLFDSHDTDRMASMFVNPDRTYDDQNRPQDNAKEKGYSHAAPDAETWKKIEQAVAFQMSFVGAPMIYYGNEAGMWGEDDPSNRQPMVWKEMKFDEPGVGFNPAVFDYYKRLIAIREALPVLRNGSFYSVKVDDAANVYGFAREAGEEKAYALFNRSAQETTIEVKLPARRLTNWMDESATKLEEKDGRPVITAAGKTISPAGGVYKIKLPAWGAAILSEGK